MNELVFLLVNAAVGMVSYILKMIYYILIFSIICSMLIEILEFIKNVI